MQGKITMYTTEWCSDCRSAKRFLNSRGIEFEEINIDRDEIAAQKVIDWSGGRRVIPTFDIHTAEDEHVILHNPGLRSLASVLEQGQKDNDDNH